MISDKEFSELLENYNISFSKGDCVQGTVVGYEGNNILVDINTKTSAICPKSEVLISKDEDIKNILVENEKYDFIIIYPQDEDGIYYLSHKKVAFKKNISLLEEKFKNDETITGKIANIVKGGILVNIMGVRGFVPSSQLKIADYKTGDEIELKIISFDLEKNNFILSNKKVYENEIEAIKKETLDKVELNMVVRGKVVRLTDFGAFIDIGGIDGLLPLSQMSWSWIENPNEILKLNDTIEVEIIGIDKEKQRISLSLKTLIENPWLKAQETIQEKQIIEGKVIAIKPFGAFVEVFPKVEGLINKTQIKEYFKKYQKSVELNDKINVLIKKFDADNQKITLEIV
ncbi:MAG: S1 RNA-binding domain-containing protein [Candidatus Gastranaerophilales bacterium]|nr:S1 RNA-binding domain-containing protein [Candidatus Gastranaerophilales bacterium]